MKEGGASADQDAQPTELKRENEEEKIVVKLSGKLTETKPAVSVKPLVGTSSVFKVPKDKWETSSSFSSKSSKSSSGEKRKSALEEIREEEERRKRRKYDIPNWLAEVNEKLIFC